MHINVEVTARIAKASVAFGRLRGMSGIEVESGLTQVESLRSKLWYYQPSYMHVKPGQCTNAMPKGLAIST